MLTIRQANLNDCFKITDIFRQVNKLHARKLPGIFNAYAPSPYLRHSFSKLIAENNRRLIVAEEDMDIVGYGEAAYRRGLPWNGPFLARTVEIDYIAVNQAHRRKGVGKALMAAIEDWAAERNCASVSLNVYKFNQGARVAYAHLGYSETCGDSLSVTMKKRLGASGQEHPHV